MDNIEFCNVIQKYLVHTGSESLLQIYRSPKIHTDTIAFTSLGVIMVKINTASSDGHLLNSTI